MTNFSIKTSQFKKQKIREKKAQMTKSQQKQRVLLNLSWVDSRILKILCMETEIRAKNLKLRFSGKLCMCIMKIKPFSFMVWRETENMTKNYSP